MGLTAPAEARPLTATQTAIMRRLCAETGLDGYAATLIVADVGERSRDSPYFDLVRPTIEAMIGEAAEPFRRWLEAKRGEWARGMQMIGEALAEALTPILRAAAVAAHDFHAAWRPRGHRRCVTCHPGRKPKPLAVNGHEYRRRQLARQKRRKRGR